MGRPLELVDGNNLLEPVAPGNKDCCIPRKCLHIAGNRHDALHP